MTPYIYELRRGEEIVATGHFLHEGYFWPQRTFATSRVLARSNTVQLGSGCEPLRDEFDRADVFAAIP